MKRLLRLNKIVAFALLACVIFSSCGKKEMKPDYDTYDPLFVDYFSNEDDYKTIHVTSLISYYLPGESNSKIDFGSYFYEVEYMLDGNDIHFHVLHVLKLLKRDVFFSLKNESECWEYFPVQYGEFLEAKKSGIKRVYSSEEVAEMIESYYNNGDEE